MTINNDHGAHYDNELVELTPAPRAATDISPKVTFAALGAALATIIIYTIEELAGIDVPATVEAAGAIVVAGGLGWLVPDSR